MIEDQIAALRSLLDEKEKEAKRGDLFYKDVQWLLDGAIERLSGCVLENEVEALKKVVLTREYQNEPFFK